MILHTVRSRPAITRRLDRRNVAVEMVVARMWEGMRLHLHYDKRRGDIWTLSAGGGEVNPEIAKLVIVHPGHCGGRGYPL